MKKSVLFICAILATTWVSAQAVIGLFNPMPVKGFVKQVQLQDTAFYTVIIQNKGNQPFTGGIPIKTEIDTGTGFMPFQLDSIIIPGNNPLAANDTAGFQLQFFPYSSPGITTSGQGNIVVIWPVNGVDSFVDTFWVNINTGIYDNPGVFEALSIYPVPAERQLNLKWNGRNVWIERVRILDMQGSVVVSEVGNTRSIDLYSLPSGTYILEIQLDTGQKGMYQILKR